MIPMQATHARNVRAQSAKPITLNTIPAVAMPDGASFLAWIPKTNPITPAMIPKIVPYPVKIQTKEIIPRTKDAVALLLFTG